MERDAQVAACGERAAVETVLGVGDGGEGGGGVEEGGGGNGKGGGGERERGRVAEDRQRPRVRGRVAGGCLVVERGPR